jgi:hypothetical protein
MDGGDLGLSSTPSGGQATVSMWINPATLSSGLEEPADGDRLFNQIGPTECCNAGVGGSIQISDGDGLYTPVNGLQVYTNAAGGWRTIATGDSPTNTIATNTWQHLAFVWNYGQVTSYLNGVETGKAVSNFSYDSAGSGTNQNFGVGARFQDTGGGFFGRSFDGLVDDVSIWNTALPADRITALAGGAAPTDIVEDPLPEPAPFAWPSPPPATLVQFWPFDDGASNASSATAANLVTGGNQANLSAGGVPESWVTTGLHAPLANRAANPSTAAVRLNSENFDIIDAGDLQLRSSELGGSVSISMWINPETLGQPGGDRLFTQIGPTGCCDSGEGGSTQLIEGSEGFGVQMWPNDGDDWRTLSDGNLPENAIVLNEWQHLAFVWNHDEVTMYLDGVETGTVVSSFAYDSAGTGVNQNFGLGARFNEAFGANYDGLMDDVTIWEGALSAQQIAALAAGAFPLALDVSLEGDYNSNGVVDAADYTVWRDAMAAGATTLPNRDSSKSGPVDAGDYAFWKSHFGEHFGAGGGSAAAVPEPSAMFLLLFGTIAAVARNRRLSG